MDLFLPWILSYLIDVIVPREQIPKLLFFRRADAALLHGSMGWQCLPTTCERHGVARGL